MSGEIFLLRDDGRLVGMGEQAYDSEDLLQSLLESYPKLLAGDQVDSANPRRWLLVTREAGVPGEERGGARWSVDHLFLDQDGVPTLVEVKRGSATRIRREVVGQMLDYAANAVVYWPVESIRAQFEAKRENPEEDLLEYLGDGADIEEFWDLENDGEGGLQEAADGLTPEIIRRRLNRWIARVGPDFSTREHRSISLRRAFSIQQVEYCRNFVFKRNHPIHKLFERSCDLAQTDGRGGWTRPRTRGNDRLIPAERRLSRRSSFVFTGWAEPP